MKPTDVIVLQSGADAKKSVVSTVHTHLRIALRGSRRPNSLRIVDVDAPDFGLDEQLIRQDLASKPLIMIMITPALLGNDKMVGEGMKTLLKLASESGVCILPVYCLKIPNPERTPWAKLAWAPWAKHGDNQPLAGSGNLDGKCCEAVEMIVQALEQEPKPEASGRSSKETVRRANRADARRQATRQPLRTVEDHKAPPLAVFFAHDDRPSVSAALSPILALLARERNVRAYTPWDVGAGANWERQEMLGGKAPVVVIGLSSQAIADDRIFAILKNLTPEQDVIFVLLSACMWSILDLKRLKHVVLPQRGAQVVSLDTFTKGRPAAWQQVADALLSRFPTALPCEDLLQLTPAETAIDEEFARRSRAAEQLSRRTPPPDYDIVKAYYEK